MYIGSEIRSIKNIGVTSYLVQKLQEKNPLQPSNAYREQYPVLIKRIQRLKILKRNYQKLLREGVANANEMQEKLNNLNKKIVEYSTELDLLSAKEKAGRLLKLVTPCNLIMPGSGNILRVTAYALRVIRILKQNIHKMEEIKSVTQEISLTGSITFVSGCASEAIGSIRKHLTDTFYY